MHHEENELEIALKKAATDESARPRFYQILLQSDILFIGSPENAENFLDTPEEFVANEKTRIGIAPVEDENGKIFIPFFTSLEEFENFVSENERYISMKASAFFEWSAPLKHEYILNPNSDYGKIFTVDEVIDLLEFGMPNLSMSKHQFKDGALMLIGQPAEYPSLLVDSLIKLFSETPSINKAYLAQVVARPHHTTPTLIIGIDCKEEDFESNGRKISVVLNDMNIGKVVDLIWIGGNMGKDAVTPYMVKETKPFYDKKWGNKLQKDAKGNA